MVPQYGYSLSPNISDIGGILTRLVLKLSQRTKGHIRYNGANITSIVPLLFLSVTNIGNVVVFCRDI